MTAIGSIVIGIGTLLGAVGAEPGTDPRPFAFSRPVRPPRKVQVMAHRGASRQAPPNTIRALELSWGDAADWAEVDVRITKDGHHVLFQDETLDRATSGTGKVRDRTLAEIQALDAGSKFARRFAHEEIPSLARAFEFSRDKINLKLNCLDVDPARLARDVIDAGMEAQVLISGSPETIAAVRAASAGRELAFASAWKASDGFASWFDRIRPSAVEILAAEASAEVCREFHRRGILVVASTLGEPDGRGAWDRAIAAGADWILTDLAEEVLAMMSMKAIGVMPIKVACHRGAGRYAPENTPRAFEKAGRLGANFIEFDVRATKDGSFFLLHDSTLDRTTSGKGPLRESSRAEVLALDAGSWFAPAFSGTKLPTLDEFLDASARTGLELYFDAKDIPPEVLAESLAKRGLAGRTVVYQGASYLAKLRAIAPEIRRMPPLGDPKRLDEIADRVRPYAFDARWSILSKEMIDRCHARGIKVFSDALGLNETVAQYQRAIRDGIDVIQTDHPVRVLRAIELLQAAK